MKTKQKGQKFNLDFEHIFIVLGSVFGLLYVFINPPWQSNDEDRHFYRAYLMADGQLFAKNVNGIPSAVMPRNLLNSVQTFQGLPIFNGAKFSQIKKKEMERVPLNAKDTLTTRYFHYEITPIAFLPHSIGIFFGKIFNDKPLWLGWFGRIGGLCFYLFVMFFAIRYAPVFKSVFFLYGLTPMVIYQAASVTYDTIPVAIYFLLTALALKYKFDDECFIGWKELILYLLLATIAATVKNGYPLIPLVLLIVPAKKFKLGMDYKIPLAIAGIYILSLYSFNILSIVWGAMMPQHNYFNVTGIMKDFGSSNSLGSLLSNPFSLISIYFRNILHFSIEWTSGTIGRFGYGYVLMPRWFIAVHGVILLLVAFSDRNPNYRLTPFSRTIVIVLAILSLFAIILGMFLNSPAGAEMVFGLQGRYFIPVIPLLLLSLYNNSVKIKLQQPALMYIISAYSLVMLIYSVVFIDNNFYTN